MKNSDWDSCYVAHGRKLSAHRHLNHKQYVHNLDAEDNRIPETYLCIYSNHFLKKYYLLELVDMKMSGGHLIKQQEELQNLIRKPRSESSSLLCELSKRFWFSVL